jgi:hypothetical protein
MFDLILGVGSGSDGSCVLGRDRRRNAPEFSAPRRRSAAGSPEMTKRCCGGPIPHGFGSGK